MNRAQRFNDNYLLLFAQELALKRKQNLYVDFNLICYMNLKGSKRKFDIDSNIKSNKVPETF